jgi:superfamily II DNA or RNA helicase
MADIYVSKESEVFIKVLASESIIAEIGDYFTFDPPKKDYRRRKNKHWDGKIRLFNRATFLLYAGLLRYLMTFASERKYTIEFAPKIGMMNEFSLVEAEEYIKKLDIYSKNEPLVPRDYQIVGLAKAIRYKRMLMVSPTSSGKSYMMYCISRYLLEKNDCKKGIIIVPTKALVKQMMTDFKDYAHGTWDVDANVHMVYAGEEKTTDKAITITTWQSIYEIENWSFFSPFDFVIGDEGHHFKANSLKEIMIKLTKARYRIATTGTLDDWEVHRLLIEGLFGPLSKLTTTKKMIDEKQSSDISIKAIILKHPTEICAAVSKWKKGAYRREIDYLIGCGQRNKFITNLTLSLKGNTLVLFQYVKHHGNILYEMINEKAINNRCCFYVHGQTDIDDRERVRAIVENENNAIIVASYGVFSEGVNIRNLHNIIFASPSKSKIRVLQSIGRGMRLSESKDHMTLYDISDDLRIDDFINYTLQHFAHRISLYRTEEFKVSNYNIELKNEVTPNGQ